ncbi:pyridoxal phosphate biosynthetic protein PdxJ [Burkholderia sp. JSH-S8]|nr:pyridoxal phosphate biosynthetic protein PdxJ [Burkholderia sp. JSH-S8]
MDDRTQPLDLTAPIPTGNIKAAAAAAGATSADLWMVPYEQLHYDPRDNVRPVDPEWVTHLTGLMIENGYDKAAPLHCYVRKVDGKDHFYVYKGQHRYLAAGNAIKAGKELGKIPTVVRAADSVSRAEMIIDGYLSNASKGSSPLELAAAVAELRDIHGFNIATICKRLRITDQTVRDVSVLERAPAEVHRMVRDGTVTGTLAIEEIRAHGGDKALERLQKGAVRAAASGKSRVTKKHLDAAPARSAAAAHVEAPAPAQTSSRPTAPTKISEKQSKQLLQALQAVLHDGGFGNLSRPTIDAVHSALMPLTDLLDAKPAAPRAYPLHTPNEHGVFPDCETISSPALKRGGQPVAELRLAQPKEGQWIFSISVRVGQGGHSGLPSISTLPHAVPTRGQAIGTGTAAISRLFEHEYRDTKEYRAWQKWRDQLLAMPDPDWTEDMSRQDVDDEIVADTTTKRTLLSPEAAWPFPIEAERARYARTGSAK